MNKCLVWFTLIVWIALTRNGHPIEPFFHPGFDDGFAPMTERLLAGDLPTSAHDGRIRSAPPQSAALWRGWRFYDALGLLLLIAWVVTLVWTRTLRRMASTRTDELRKSEERYRTISEDMPVLICRFLPCGEITYVNDAYCMSFDRTSEALIGSSFLSLIPEEEEHESVMVGISALTVESPVHSHEHKVLASDGEAHWQRWTHRALFDDRGEIVAYQSIGEDITQRKRAEEKLKESEAKLRLMIEQSPLGVCMNDLDGTFVSANPAYEKLIGYTEEELQKLTFFDITHPDDRPENRRLFQGMTFEETVSFRMEKRYFRKDGSEISVIVHAGPICDPSGSPLFGLALVEDITDRKRVDEELANHHAGLEKEVRERTREQRLLVNAMAGRENRMAELKGVIKKLRTQLEEAGMTPVADDSMEDDK
jgi:PAS domain S-box-containing protein